jgi:CBS domain-containing protein
MKTVGSILGDKPNQAIYTITPSATVLEAITLMAEKGIGALIVADAGKVVGIVSERDYARKVALMERSSYGTRVEEIMSKDVISVTTHQTNEHCMILMTEKRLRHLPVIENDKLLGLISIGDLVKGVIEDQKNLIEQLQRYIRGE